MAMYEMDGLSLLEPERTEQTEACPQVAVTLSHDRTVAKKNTRFRTLVKTKPDAAIKVLDDCVTFDRNEEKYSFKFELEFSYHSSEETDDPSSAARADNTRTSHTLNGYDLEKMEGDLLLHPVVLSFLRWKWLKYVGFFFFLTLALYLTFLISLTAFALTVPNPQLPACRGEEYNQTNTSNTSSISCDVSYHRRILISAAVITIICCLVRLFLEFIELTNLRNVKYLKGLSKGILKKTFWKEISTIIDWKYFLSPSNYIEIPLFILSIAFVSVFSNKCLCPSRGQWQAGIVAVFLAWIDLIFYLDKLPLFGVYVQMLLKIIRNFFNVSIMAIFLLFAFGFAFFMAFYEPGLPDTPFENPAVTFVNMISYAIGSPDISIFRLSNDDTRVKTIPYPGLSYIIWVIFAIIVSVLFLNLLTGLAVEDVRELQGQAQKKRVKEQIKLLNKTEVWVQRLLTLCRKQKVKLSKLLKRRTPPKVKLSRKNSTWDPLLYFIGDERKDIVQKASEILEKRNQPTPDIPATPPNIEERNLPPLDIPATLRNIERKIDLLMQKER